MKKKLVKILPNSLKIGFGGGGKKLIRQKNPNRVSNLACFCNKILFMFNRNQFCFSHSVSVTFLVAPSRLAVFMYDRQYSVLCLRVFFFFLLYFFVFHFFITAEIRQRVQLKFQHRS